MAALGVHFALWWLLALVLWTGGSVSWAAALEAPLAPILLALDAGGERLLLGCTVGGLLLVAVLRSMHRPRPALVGRAHLFLLVWWLLSLHELATR